MPSTPATPPARRTARDLLDELAPGATRIDVAPSRPDPLGWTGYDEARVAATTSSGEDESVVVVVGTVAGTDAEAVIVTWEFSHLGGSMGQDAGARIAAAYDLARDRRLPVVLATASGGARMQEGMASLVQMAATSVAAVRHAEAGLLQVAVLRHPTTGGVFASHANLADVMIAESGATIGFAGPRVAEALTGGSLPEHSHTAQGALASGLVDHLVDPGGAVAVVGPLLHWASAVEVARLSGWRSDPPSTGLRDLAAADPGTVDAWAAVLASRADGRARASAWLAGIEVAAELHGDRAGRDDRTLRVDLAHLGSAPIIVVALDRDVADGNVSPAGYRKAWRGFALAQRLGIPVVTLLDTAGADASAAAEAGGIAHHIARTFAELLTLTVPTVALVTGEGGSGGALALAVCDRLVMLEHSTFSVIAPEGAAAILHRDASLAPEVAAQLRPDAATLYRLGIADAVITEQGDPVANGWAAVAHALADLSAQDAQARTQARMDRWRAAPSRP